jgi:hypothetical protein
MAKFTNRFIVGPLGGIRKGEGTLAGQPGDVVKLATEDGLFIIAYDEENGITVTAQDGKKIELMPLNAAQVGVKFKHQDSRLNISRDDLAQGLDFLDQFNGPGRKGHAADIILGHKTWDDWNKE